MSIRKPDNPLASPNTVKLKKGVRIERVHNRNYAANQFNPCKGNPTRFAPIHNTGGQCVPSLYAGETFEAAVYETIFHDVPVNAKRKYIPQRRVLDNAQGCLETLRDITLISLRQPDLNIWRIKRSQLIASSPTFYAGTAEWAEATHHQFSNAEGLEWTSNQCDPATAYLFSGDRVNAGDFKIIHTRDGRTDAGFRQDVKEIGNRSGILITI